MLADRTSDPALLALALRPPRLSILADRQTPIDIDALHHARMRQWRAWRESLPPTSSDAFAAHRTAGAYSADPAQVARRSLKNVCLAYLTTRDDAASHALALAQFDAADNMTDAMAALAALNDTAAEARDIAMSRFESRWRDNPLVMDKWLALQATSCRPGTLERVRALLSHPVYDARNPNRIRSLVGAFAQSNLPAIPRRGRRRLRVRRRPGAYDRSQQSAGRRAARRRIQPLAAIRHRPRRTAARCARADLPPRQHCRPTSRKSSRTTWPTRRYRPVRKPLPVGLHCVVAGLAAAVAPHAAQFEYALRVAHHVGIAA